MPLLCPRRRRRSIKFGRCQSSEAPLKSVAARIMVVFRRKCQVKQNHSKHDHASVAFSGLFVSRRMVGQLGLVWTAGRRVSDLFTAWHSAPQNYRDRLLQGLSFCLGNSEEQRWVAVLELLFLGLAVAFAFVVGRLTAHIPLRWWGDRELRRRVVLPRRGKLSRFGDDDSNGSVSSSSARGLRDGPSPRRR